MGITIRRVRPEWYVPAYGGNRARAQADPTYTPFQVQLRLPTWIERRQHIDAMAAAADQDARIRIQADYLAGHIVGVLELADEDGTVITTGPQLLELAGQVDAELIDELNRALARQENLDEGLRGNFARPRGSGGLSPTTVGTAESAAPRGSTS